MSAPNGITFNMSPKVIFSNFQSLQQCTDPKVVEEIVHYKTTWREVFVNKNYVEHEIPIVSLDKQIKKPVKIEIITSDNYQDNNCFSITKINADQWYRLDLSRNEYLLKKFSDKVVVLVAEVRINCKFIKESFFRFKAPIFDYKYPHFFEIIGDTSKLISTDLIVEKW